MFTGGPQDNLCTCAPQGNWGLCCYDHDAACIAARECNSAEMRLKADRTLRDCIRQKGHPIVAEIYYMAVRTWVNIKGK